MSATDTLLQQGIAAARAGRREEARALLMRVVEADERSEQGWLWLAGVVDDPDDMRTCLENVLDLNPTNAKAQQGLAWVEARYGPRPAPETTREPAEAGAQPRDAAPSTGPTIRLAPDEAVAESVADRPPADPAPIVAPATSENPCPYCGAPTALTQKRCTQCQNSLMIRGAPRAPRSLALTILGWLWCVGGVLSLLGAALILALSFMPQGGRPGQPATQAPLLANAILSMIGGLISLGIGRGLLRRARWAYIAHCILTALGLIVLLIQAAVGGGLLLALTRSSGGALSPGQARAAAVPGIVLGAIIFCVVAWELIYLLLTVLSYRDFYGPALRFLPTVEATDHMGHYNNGVAYKNRGMWYMAAKEWEAAVGRAPRDLSYLHALGLAYAQIKQLYPQSTQNLQSIRHLLLSRKDELYAKAPELERLNLL
jgi:tetratricopeptide (TPR) repeat protein